VEKELAAWEESSTEASQPGGGAMEEDFSKPVV
jgi:hypothetical protein